MFVKFVSVFLIFVLVCVNVHFLVVGAQASVPMLYLRAFGALSTWIGPSRNLSLLIALRSGGLVKSAWYVVPASNVKLAALVAALIASGYFTYEILRTRTDALFNRVSQQYNLVKENGVWKKVVEGSGSLRLTNMTAYHLYPDYCLQCTTRDYGGDRSRIHMTIVSDYSTAVSVADSIAADLRAQGYRYVQVLGGNWKVISWTQVRPGTCTDFVYDESAKFGFREVYAQDPAPSTKRVSYVVAYGTSSNPVIPGGTYTRNLTTDEIRDIVAESLASDMPEAKRLVEAAEAVGNSRLRTNENDTLIQDWFDSLIEDYAEEIADAISQEGELARDSEVSETEVGESIVGNRFIERIEAFKERIGESILGQLFDLFKVTLTGGSCLKEVSVGRFGTVLVNLCWMEPYLNIFGYVLLFLASYVAARIIVLKR